MRRKTNKCREEEEVGKKSERKNEKDTTRGRLRRRGQTYSPTNDPTRSGGPGVERPGANNNLRVEAAASRLVSPRLPLVLRSHKGWYDLVMLL